MYKPMLDKCQTIIENQARSHIKNQSNIIQDNSQVDTWISRYVTWDIRFTKNFKFGF
jgi:hypothetical protein